MKFVLCLINIMVAIIESSTIYQHSKFKRNFFFEKFIGINSSWKSEFSNLIDDFLKKNSCFPIHWVNKREMIQTDFFKWSNLKTDVHRRASSTRDGARTDDDVDRVYVCSHRKCVDAILKGRIQSKEIWT